MLCHADTAELLRADPTASPILAPAPRRILWKPAIRLWVSHNIVIPPVETGRHAEWVYPRSMARKPSEPSPKSTDSKTSDSAETTDSTEITGPIAIVRLRKADGRALILYSASGDRA